MGLAWYNNSGGHLGTMCYMSWTVRLMHSLINHQWQKHQVGSVLADFIDEESDSMLKLGVST